MSGLVGHWPLHEWSGSAQDLSGNGNTGTVNGATQGAYGVGGLTAYSFDDTDSVQIPSSESLDEFTICVWIRSSDVTNNTKMFGDGGGTPEGRTNGGDLEYYDGTSWRTVGSVTENEWHHTALVQNSSGTDYGYIDGVETELSNWSDSTVFDDTNFFVGRGAGGSEEHWRGALADVRVYNRPLSTSEIQTLYEWGSDDYTKQSLHDGSDSGAVSRYEFTSGSVTADSWGSNTLDDQTSAGTTTDAIRGDAKSFDGTDDYMNVPSGIVSATDDFTVSFWINYNSTNRGRIVTLQEDIAFTTEVNGTSNNALSFWEGNSFTDIDSSLSTGDWYHGVVTYDESATEFVGYLNGVKKATVSTDSSSGSGNSNAIGIQEDLSSRPFDGDIDDVRIYDRALSAWEVAQLYRWGTRGRDMRQRMVRQ